MGVGVAAEGGAAAGAAEGEAFMGLVAGPLLRTGGEESWASWVAAEQRRRDGVYSALRARGGERAQASEGSQVSSEGSQPGVSCVARVVACGPALQSVVACGPASTRAAVCCLKPPPPPLLPPTG
jgi:hypothetical protein